ncbi:MAG: hypothetical protein ACKV2T_26745 [Kofleriaceae bacterium]
MIAEALALVVDSEVLARIAGPIGEAARDRAREIARLDEKTSRATRATWLAAARTPIPAGLRGIDATWIEVAITRIVHIERDGDERDAGHEHPRAARLDALAARARRVLLDGPGSDGDVWLARWLCASFPPMPAIEEHGATGATSAIVRPRSISEAVAMSAVNLRAWLEEVGADTLAFAVGKDATAMSSRLGAAAVRIAQAPRFGEMGDRRSAIERARITFDESALLRVGARTVGPHAGEIERRQLAHRLPRDTGVLAEMEAFAGSAGAPTWRALAAP